MSAAFLRAYLPGPPQQGPGFSALNNALSEVAEGRLAREQMAQQAELERQRREAAAEATRQKLDWDREELGIRNEQAFKLKDREQKIEQDKWQRDSQYKLHDEISAAEQTGDATRVLALRRKAAMAGLPISVAQPEQTPAHAQGPEDIQPQPGQPTEPPPFAPRPSPGAAGYTPPQVQSQDIPPPGPPPDPALQRVQIGDDVYDPRAARANIEERSRRGFDIVNGFADGKARPVERQRAETASRVYRAAVASGLSEKDALTLAGSQGSSAASLFQSDINAQRMAAIRRDPPAPPNRDIAVEGQRRGMVKDASGQYSLPALRKQKAALEDGIALLTPGKDGTVGAQQSAVAGRRLRQFLTGAAATASEIREEKGALGLAESINAMIQQYDTGGMTPRFVEETRKTLHTMKKVVDDIEVRAETTLRNMMETSVVPEIREQSGNARQLLGLEDGKAAQAKKAEGAAIMKAIEEMKRQQAADEALLLKLGAGQ